jgi:hypothetical protein
LIIKRRRRSNRTIEPNAFSKFLSRRSIEKEKKGFVLTTPLALDKKFVKRFPWSCYPSGGSKPVHTPGLVGPPVVRKRGRRLLLPSQPKETQIDVTNADDRTLQVLIGLDYTN